jgi:hypothetical protein
VEHSGERRSAVSEVNMYVVDAATASQQKRFVIEFVDSGTGCICDEINIETSDVGGLSEIANPGGGGIRPSGVYDLNRSNLNQIEKLLGLSIAGVAEEARLRSWRLTDDLPYKVHTNRELALMLKREKPLSVFSERLPSNPEFELIPERFFAPYVEAGLFHNAECVILDARGSENRFVFYAARGEEWRINAYILLKKTAILSGWSEGFERMEGSLLGYEDWQNDVYIKQVFDGRVRGNSLVPST